MGNQKYKELTRDELDAIAGEPLPERAAMSLMKAHIAAPIDATSSSNAFDDDSSISERALQNDRNS